VLNDIAQQSKKGFNAIMQKLGGDKGDREEGGFVVVGRDDAEQGATGLQRRGTTARGDPTRGMGTMRGVKVKREADEAGKSRWRHGMASWRADVQIKLTGWVSSTWSRYGLGGTSCRRRLSESAVKLSSSGRTDARTWRRSTTISTRRL
jgi:hypothetical protein